MDLDVASLFWFVVPGILVPALLLVLAFRSPSPRQLERWAEEADVALTDDTRPLVAHHLGRVRRWRSCAGFPFWWLIFAPVVIGDRWPDQLTSPAIGVSFYVVGGLVAELTTPVPRGGERRAAALSQRQVGDYLPAWARQTPWWLLGTTAATVLVTLAAGDRWEPTGSVGVVVGAVAVGIGVALLAEVVARAVTARAQRSADPSVLAADDALRCTAVSSANAAAMLAGFAVLGQAVDALTPAGMGWWYAPFGIVQLLLTGLSVGALALIVRQELWGPATRLASAKPAPA